MITIKLIFSLIIFVIALLAGLIPLWRNASHLFFKKSEALVSGIFLGTAFFHLLPDANVLLHTGLSQHAFSLPYLLAAMSFLIFWGIGNLNKLKIGSDNLLPWLIFIILSFHSIIAGLTLGLIHVSSMLWILFIAVIAHKAFDSFALLIILNRYHFNHRHIAWIITLFSLMTPFGIYLGSVTFKLLNTTMGDLVTGYFNAIAAGSFIYVGFTEGLLYQWIMKKVTVTRIEIFLMLMGFSIMAFLSLWV